MHTLKSVQLAVEVLKCLSGGDNRLSDIARRLNLSKSNVYRLLKALEVSGMVTQDKHNKRYLLGYTAVRIAYPMVYSQERLIMFAFEEMRRLRDLSGETIILFTLIGSQVVVVEELQSTHGVKMSIGKGTQSPLYIGGASQVLLSFLNDDEVERLIRNLDIVMLTPYTFTDKEVLLEKVKEVREQGWASSPSAQATGALTLTVPVANYFRPLALSILSVEARTGMEQLVTLLPELKESAARLAKKLREEFPVDWHK
jgi:DNA-binding IclR family transcriptional regulator